MIQITLENGLVGMLYTGCAEVGIKADIQLPCNSIMSGTIKEVFYITVGSTTWNN